MDVMLLWIVLGVSTNYSFIIYHGVCVCSKGGNKKYYFIYPFYLYFCVSFFDWLFLYIYQVWTVPLIEMKVDANEVTNLLKGLVGTDFISIFNVPSGKMNITFIYLHII